MSNRIRIVIMVLIPVVLGSGYLWSRSASRADLSTTATDTPRDTRLGVRVRVVEPAPFSYRIQTTGTVLALDEVWLQAEATGRLVSLNIREGGYVEKGDLLAKINDADLQARLRRTQLNLELAEMREERQRRLLENRAIAQEDYDVALNELNTVKAEIDLIQADIRKTEVRAPFSGRLGLRSVSEGALVTAGTRLASLQNLDRIRIDFSVPERYAADVAVGDEIRFTRAGSDAVYTARVIAIEPRIDPDTRTLAIRAETSNPGTRILPGAFTDIRYELRSVPDARMVPAEALIPELGRMRLFVIEDGKAVSRTVTTGVRTDRFVQILDGVRGGDSVITTGILQLRDGMPVRVSETDTTEAL